MRLLALTNLYPNPYQPHRGQFNRQQFAALARRHQVQVIAPIAWTDELAQRRLQRSRLRPGRVAHCDDLKVVHPRYIFPPRILRRWYGHFFRWSVRSAFDACLESFRPELVFAAWAYPDGWAAVELAHAARLPVVIKVHGSDVLQLSACPARRGPTIQALSRADGVMAVSHHLAGELATLGVCPQRIRVVYDGINADRFHPGSRGNARRRLELPASMPIMLFVGNLLEVKGLDLLIDAADRLRRRGLRFLCLMIGQGPLHQQLSRRIQRLGLAESVRLLGPRPHEQLPDWYRAADLFVLPSRSEGLPNVLLEALACGTPFVASRVGGIPELAAFGPGTLVPPGEAAALADALAGWLETRPDPAATAPFSRGHDAAASELAGWFSQIIADRRAATLPADRRAAALPAAVAAS